MLLFLTEGKRAYVVSGGQIGCFDESIDIHMLRKKFLVLRFV
jgi:hypothetical protein